MECTYNIGYYSHGCCGISIVTASCLVFGIKGEAAWDEPLAKRPMRPVRCQENQKCKRPRSLHGVCIVSMVGLHCAAGSKFLPNLLWPVGSSHQPITGAEFPPPAVELFSYTRWNDNSEIQTSFDLDFAFIIFQALQRILYSLQNIFIFHYQCSLQVLAIISIQHVALLVNWKPDWHL